MDMGIGIIADAKVDITEKWAREPKVIALTLLSRTLANLKGAVSMIHQKLVVEARMLTRCCFENLICIGALNVRGSEFVNDLISDHAASGRRQGNLLLQQASKASIAPFEDKIRAFIADLERKHPKAKKLNTRDAANVSAVRQAYLWFSLLSSHAVHVSARSLGRHLAREKEGDLHLPPGKCCARTKVHRIARNAGIALQCGARGLHRCE